MNRIKRLEKKKKQLKVAGDPNSMMNEDLSDEDDDDDEDLN